MEKMGVDMLYRNTPLKEPGFSSVEINLDELFNSEGEYITFLEKFKVFIENDSYAPNIIKVDENQKLLSYITENILPDKNDGRKRVLYLFGNPATHSVKHGIPFSFEKNEKRCEHRIWQAFRRAGLINLQWKAPIDDDQIVGNKRILFNLEYEAPFRFSLDVLITLPSSSSNKKHGNNAMEKKFGVDKIKCLLGTDSFNELIKHETERLEKVIMVHDAVIAFQKDAYEAVRTKDSPSYKMDAVYKSGLYGETFHRKPLFCAPITKLILGKIDVLENIRNKIEVI